MKQKHPAGLYVAFFTGFWQCFGYWGILSLLVIYLTKAFSFPDHEAYAFYGCYTALAWITPVLGGFLADRFIGYQKAVGIGLVLSFIGNFILALSRPGIFLYIGLSLLIAGIGFFYSNNNNLVGTLYDANDPKRDRGFTILSVSTNMGGLLGPIVYGIIATHFSWHYNFYISATGGVIATLIFLSKRKLFASNIQAASKSISSNIFKNIINSWGFLFLLPVFIIIVSLLLSHPLATGTLLGMSGVVVLGMWGMFIFRSNPFDREHIFLLLLMAVFCLIFYAGELQTTSSLILFADREVNRNIFGILFPSPAVASLEPFFFIVVSPLIVKTWEKLSMHNLEPSMLTKVSSGLLFCGIGFAVFGWAAYQATVSDKCSFLWLLSGNVLLAIGELCILPTLISGITKLAPANLKGTFMGTFYLALAFSGYLAGMIARFTGQPTTDITAVTHYNTIYVKIAIAMTFVSVVSYLIAFLLRGRYTVPSIIQDE